MKDDIPIITTPSVKQKKLQLINKLNREIRKVIDSIKDESGEIDKEELDLEIKKMLEKYKNKYSVEFTNSSLVLSTVSLGDAKLQDDDLHINITTYENRDLEFVFPKMKFKSKEKDV